MMKSLHKGLLTCHIGEANIKNQGLPIALSPTGLQWAGQSEGRGVCGAGDIKGTDNTFQTEAEERVFDILV